MPAIPRSTPTRRAWLAAAATACWGASARASGPGEPAEDPAVEAVRDRAREVGLGPFPPPSRKGHFLGIGDAPDAFRARALEICHHLARDFLAHFDFKGFDARPPDRPLVVVTLADAGSFARFSGEGADPGVGGYYDRQANRLVMFDNRAQGGLDRTTAERANLVALAHEATHQLTFNTGLLEREGDVPLCIGEGLATYAEVRKPIGPSKLGQPNLERLKVLGQRNGASWTHVARLFTADERFEGGGDDAAVQWLYAQSWLLVYELMKPPRPEPFRRYLDAIRDRRDPAHRVDDARAHLGDLDRLDRALRRAAGWPAGA